MPAASDPSTHRSTACLRFLDTAFLVESADEAAIRWLHEFLAPWFDAPAGDSALTVRVRHVLEREPAGTGPFAERLPFGRLDSQVLRLPGRRDGDRIQLHDATRDCRYTIELPARGEPPAGRRPQVTVHSWTRQRRIGLMRVLREIAVESERARANPVELHAAAFESRGGALVLAGAKESGKTTLLLHAARRLGARVIANDRVLVHLGSGRVTGVPAIIKVRAETAARFPELAWAAPAVAHAAQLTIEEADRARQTAGPAGLGRGLSLSAAQLARSLPAALIAGAPLRAVVFSDGVGEAPLPRLEPLSPLDARDRLAAARYGGVDRRAVPTVFTDLVARFGGAPATPPVTQSARIAALAAATPCFRLAPAGEPDRAVDLLAALL